MTTGVFINESELLTKTKDDVNTEKGCNDDMMSRLSMLVFVYRLVLVRVYLGGCLVHDSNV